MTALHPQLAKDCIRVGRFALCHVLLMDDANYPWLILVPDREGVREIYELSEPDQLQLTRESVYLAGRLAECLGADKMNVAALGNVVPQLHVHHIVRYAGDPSWPAPVWGKVTPRRYGEEESAALLERVRSCLGNALGFCRDPGSGARGP